MAIPAAILNIGPRDGQNHFAVQVAPTGASSIVIHSQDEISAGYEEDPYFVHTSDGRLVQFWARMDGPTTSGSSYARSELRELNPDGSNMAFDFSKGTHWIHGRSTITHLPPNKPETVIAQLHNGNADRIAIRTQVISGQIKLVVRVNGSAVTPRLAEPYVLGTEFEWKIELVDGVGYVYYNDMTTPIITTHALVATSGPTWYYKAGNYNQSNDTIDVGTEYGSTELRDLAHWHTGWSTSGVLTATGSVDLGGDGLLSGVGTVATPAPIPTPVALAGHVKFKGSGRLRVRRKRHS